MEYMESRMQDQIEGALHSQQEAMERIAQLESDLATAEQDSRQRQEPVGVLHVGSCYGEELEDWEFEADQRVCDRLNERHVTNPTSLKLYALPGAQPAPGAPWVSLAERMPNPDKHDRVLIYTEGYDFGGEQVFDVKAEALNECRYSDPDEQPETCKAASHWMPHPRNVIFDYAARYAQPAPSVPTALLVAVVDLIAQMEIVRRVGFIDTPDDKDSCAAFCVAEGTWLELMSAVESLTAALAATPEAKP